MHGQARKAPRSDRQRHLRRGSTIIRRNLAVGIVNLRLARFQRTGRMHCWPLDAYAALLEQTGFRLVHHELGYVCRADLICMSVPA